MKQFEATQMPASDVLKMYIASKSTYTKKTDRLSADIVSSKHLLLIEMCDEVSGKPLRYFSDVNEAVLSLGIKSPREIIDCCEGIVPSAYGFKWQHKRTMSELQRKKIVMFA